LNAGPPTDPTARPGNGLGARAQPAAPLDCDVFIVGGGIHGTSIARDLAGRGLRVVLAEQQDFASHASSSSSKLLYGGLGPQDAARLAPVRETLQERELLLRSAPHITWPLRFVLPHNPQARGDDSPPAWKIRLGLFVYDRLARRERLQGSGGVDLRTHGVGAPLQSQYTRGFIYSDGWVEDARLTVLNAVHAREHGATLFTRTRCIGAQRGDREWSASLQHRDGSFTTVRARALVNACGAWAEPFLRGVARPARGEALARRSVRRVKGSHIVVPRLFEHDHAYVLPGNGRRAVFVIPYEQRFTLIGATEAAVEDELGDASFTHEEIEDLCLQAGRYFKQAIVPADVVWAYSGVRVTLDTPGDRLLEPDTVAAPLLTVWGGSIATARKLAEDASNDVSRMLGESIRPWTRGAFLPGGDLSEWIGSPIQPDVDFQRFVIAVRQRHPWLLEVVARRLARAYGSRIDRVLGDAQSFADMGTQVGPGLFEAELRYLRREEWATQADDVLWRRSKLGLHFSPEESVRVAEWMSEPSGTPRAQPKLRVA
jgi:glycerol-3-phosphate dehydrogenase